MDIRPRDPLLTIARVLCWFFIAVFAVVTLAMTAAIPLVAFNNASIVAELADNGVQVGGQATLAIILVLLGVAALMALAIWFFWLLLKIIDSVGEGDPFAPANAERLNRMAWISLGGYFATWPLGALMVWLGEIARKAGENVDVDLDIGGGLLLSLVLFILARVFRHGAAMRDDLEGTV